jgi:hypothetical protein
MRSNDRVLGSRAPKQEGLVFSVGRLELLCAASRREIVKALQLSVYLDNMLILIGNETFLPCEASHGLSSSEPSPRCVLT